MCIRQPVRLPDRVFTMALLKRATFLWVGIRVIVVLLLAATGSGFTTRTAMLVVLLVGFLSLLDSQRRNEHIFWANLGVAPWTLAVLSSVPALVGEVVVAWMWRI